MLIGSCGHELKLKDIENDIFIIKDYCNNYDKGTIDRCICIISFCSTCAKEHINENLVLHNEEEINNWLNEVNN